MQLSSLQGQANPIPLQSGAQDSLCTCTAYREKLPEELSPGCRSYRTAGQSADMGTCTIHDQALPAPILTQLSVRNVVLAQDGDGGILRLLTGAQDVTQQGKQQAQHRQQALHRLRSLLRGDQQSAVAVVPILLGLHKRHAE